MGFAEAPFSPKPCFSRGAPPSLSTIFLALILIICYNNNKLIKFRRFPPFQGMRRGGGIFPGRNSKLNARPNPASKDCFFFQAPA